MLLATFLHVALATLILDTVTAKLTIKTHYKRQPLQDIVTWDHNSLFIRGERVLIYSGEFHPFRLPVPSLWLDVFQKIRAMGYNGVSFYIDWNLLEGKPGRFSAEGVFSFDPFFAAAEKAGIYLIARPGPYINAEVSGGGFPGWIQRVKGTLRTSAPDYIAATENYMQSISKIIAKAQITNGGPVILFQPENEYTLVSNGAVFDPAYMQTVEDQARNAGIVVPLISNDAWPTGVLTPGSGVGEVEIYGHDGYPLGFNCANPYNWPNTSLPTDWRSQHLTMSPSTPYSILEFQGGSFDPWGGSTFEKCSVLLNMEFERVFFKNNYASGVRIFNVYMTYGGTNWGNLGHPGGYTSYDYGSTITEDRQVYREKYSESKLQATFLQSSPSYLTAIPQALSAGKYTDTTAITTTPLFGNRTSFWVVRQSQFYTLDTTTYKLTVPTSVGNITIPQLGGSLSLNGRDSKIHVTDYDLGGINLLYSSAEIFTWKKYPQKTVLVLYGGVGEIHEAAFSYLDRESASAQTVEGEAVTYEYKTSSLILNWTTTASRRVVLLPGNLFVYIVDRNSAYNYWVPPSTSLILRAGYLIRTASEQGSIIAIRGDLNETTSLELLGAPETVTSLTFNSRVLRVHQDPQTGALSTVIPYTAPKMSLPDLSQAQWHFYDSLPELTPSYSDEKWTTCNLTTSNNPRKLTTPTSLYASDYGYHTGSLLFRGHFTSDPSITGVSITAGGGSAFGFSVFVNSTFLGSWAGNDRTGSYTLTLPFPNPNPEFAGTETVLTVIIDHMGLDENWVVGSETAKKPRGILDYTLTGASQNAIQWKLTGNLGGEDYADFSRGPLNEGGMSAERNGFHLPPGPASLLSWPIRSPIIDGIEDAGVGFYATTFSLDIPRGFDVPLSFVFTNSSSTAQPYRAQLFVNGWQFGKYLSNVGPQTAFPVPEGVLNYHGDNYVAITLWALTEQGAKIPALNLIEGGTGVITGYENVVTVVGESWKNRVDAY